MVLPLLKGSRLDGYILCTKKCPEANTSKEGDNTPNPAYEEWVTTNKLLQGWLLNSMSQEFAT